MIIDNVKEVTCYIGNSMYDRYKDIRQFEIYDIGGGYIRITTKDGAEVILVNMPCRVNK